jgi:DNA-binding GntR family transcriptional regulator
MHGDVTRTPPAGCRIVIGQRGDARAWVLVANMVLGMITSGEVRPGGRVPTRQQLASDAGVGIDTVNHALRVLAGEGVLRRVRGLGTYVQPAFTVAVDQVARDAGLLTAVLPGGAP